VTDRRREIIFGLGLLVPVAIGFAAVEWLLQAREARTAARKVNWTALYDQAGAGDDERLLFKPGARVGKIAFNALGFRGPEVAIPKAANTVRVMFLGDSKTFAGEVQEDEALAAQSVAKLRVLRPRCSFDYVNVSGPGYSLRDLTTLVHAKKSVIDPDLTVVLAGSASDLLGAIRKGGARAAARTAQDQRAKPSPLSALLARSETIKIAQREIGLISPFTPPNGPARQSLESLAMKHRLMLDQLSAAVGGLPTITIAYRTPEKGGSGIASYWLGARRLRTAFPGISIAKARATLKMVVDVSRDHAAANGWRQIDPQLDMIRRPEYFVDRTHFSPPAHAKIGAAVAEEAAMIVTDDCRVVRARR
jgi:lysophospholipase L1-like esterase